MHLIDEININLTRFQDKAGRVFHGRGKNFPGLEQLNIEWYPPYLLVQNFESELPEGVLENLKMIFSDHPQISAVMLQSREFPHFKTEILCERAKENKSIELPLKFWAKLDEGIVCEASLGKNRNTGVFLDMRAGWDWVKENAKDKTVLNLFSYTSVFSLYALSGGASRVTNVDMAANVLKISQRNHQKNELHDGRAIFLKRNIVESMKSLSRKGPFDLLIVDPPPYQKNAFHGWRDYQVLLQKCELCLNPGGAIFLCLNNPSIDIGEFLADLKTILPKAQYIERIETAAEIKELDTDKGLKTVAVHF